MSQAYKHNHYVPEWYQKRFLPNGQSRHYYLDLHPETVRQNGHNFTRKALLLWGPNRCFAQDDLYTTHWGGLENRDIEKFFFGQIDSGGAGAVEHFADWAFDGDSADAFQTLVPYMSIQKLRTPKGLGWLRTVFKETDANATLFRLQRLQNLFCTIWGECVWQIADASYANTKFIISDHPIVTYNRECFPGSKHCSGYNDPDIRHHATHTFFPLSPDKILILTNLSWVRDPYQNPMTLRPNPDLMRPGAPFSFLDIQVDRFLSEEEVIEINYITKRRAFRFIAAAEEEWLYPERHMRTTNWRKLGDGYLLMPDPRHIYGGGEIFVGYDDGRSDGWSEYGHKSWQTGYKDEARQSREWDAMDRFKAEWARTYGAEYRGVTNQFASAEHPVQKHMSDEYHASECARDREYSKRPGERARRRKLMR